MGYWPLDEVGKGNMTEDKSGAGNDGILKGKADLVDGIKGKALRFDGVSGWVDCGSDVSLQQNGPITCMFWFSPLTEIKAGLARWNLVYYANGPMFRTEDTGQILAWMDGHLGQGKVSFGVSSERDNWPVGEWFHLACVYERDVAFIFYINGVKDGRTFAKGDIEPRSGTLGIGGSDWGAFSHAIIDEVKYYDKALSAYDIAREFKFRGGEAVEPQDKLASTWGGMKSK